MIHNQKRKGSGILALAIITGAFSIFSVGLIYKYVNSYMGSVGTSSVARQAELFADDRVELLKATRYSNIAGIEKQAVGNNYFEEVILGSEDTETGTREITVNVYHGNDTSPMISKTVKRSISNLRYKEPSQTIGADKDRPISQAASSQLFALKSDTARFTGAQGNTNQGIYIDADGNPQPVNQIFRQNYNTASDKILVFNGDYIDYLLKSDLKTSGIVAQSISRKQGYVEFANGVVLAYKNDYSTVNAKNNVKITKPVNFTTFQAYSTDTTQGLERTSARTVWQASQTTDNSDTFRLDTNASQTSGRDYFSVFWIGKK